MSDRKEFEKQTSLALDEWLKTYKNFPTSEQLEGLINAARNYQVAWVRSRANE